MFDITSPRFKAVGDGATDCTNAIAAAIAAAATHSSFAERVVYVPEGVFRLRPVILASSVTLHVDGTLRAFSGKDAMRR